MDFEQAITSHIQWKQKLVTYLKKLDHSLSPVDAERADKCDLGKWIAGEGAKHGSMPEFQTLRSEHARFHKAAANVIRHADSGQNVNEEIALGSKSEFSSASSAVVNSLSTIKFKIAKQVLATK